MPVVQSYIPALANVDSYKTSHKQFSPAGLEEVYSNLTPRFDKYFKDKYPDFDGFVVNFGQQYLVNTIDSIFKEFFSNDIDIEMARLESIIGPAFGLTNFDHFKALHELGYLPVEIKSLPEGCLLKVGTPLLTIRNTHPDFAWLTNYLENLISIEMWKPVTVATLARQFRLLSEKFSDETCDDNSHVKFQNHDFSQRGQAGRVNNSILGVAWLIQSIGTDNVPALYEAINSYKGHESKVIGLSISASEHSLSTLGIQLANTQNNYESDPLYHGELNFLNKCLTEYFPSGMFSYVADTYDYWKTLSDVLRELKSVIMTRDGRLVIRPDSGDPINVVCGSFKYETFESLEAALSDLKDTARDDLSDECDSDGYCDEVTYKIKVSDTGKFYNVSVRCSVTSERGGYSDNSYYVIDEIYDPVATEITLSPEQKGSVEVLWEIFGGTINSKGYKVLDPHIGIIYGDGITYHRAKEILTRLKEKGFASSNIVFGIGSYSLNLLSRDDLGMAVKATHAVVSGQSIPLYKDPKTDSSKKSLRGYLTASLVDGQYVVTDGQDFAAESGPDNAFETIYLDGKVLSDVSLDDLRERQGFVINF